MDSLIILGLVTLYFTAKFIINRHPYVKIIIEKVTINVEKIINPIEKLINKAVPPLAYMWIICVLLTLIDWFTPLDFNPYVASSIHCGIWLLIFFATSYFGWSYKWQATLWLGSTVIGLISAVLALWPLGLPFIYYEIQFFTPNSTWQTSYVYFKRENAVVVDQIRFDRLVQRRVLVQPITSLFQWAKQLPYVSGNVPPAKPAGAGWTVVNRKAEDFSPDADEQRKLDLIKENEQRCWANRHRIDSLARQGQFPPSILVLPAATQHGANTVGCLVNGEVWRDYLILVGPGKCEQRGALGTMSVNPRVKGSFFFGVSAMMRIGKIYRNINLVVRELRGIGMYKLNNDLYETYSPEAPHLLLKAQKTTDNSNLTDDYITTNKLPSTVIITRFDTVARVVSGTFEGDVYDLSNRVGPVSVTQGRFDVHYTTLR